MKSKRMIGGTVFSIHLFDVATGSGRLLEVEALDATRAARLAYCLWLDAGWEATNALAVVFAGDGVETSYGLVAEVALWRSEEGKYRAEVELSSD